MTAPVATEAQTAPAATETPSAPSAPEFEGRASLDGMIEHSADTVFTDTALQALAGRESISVADLRTLPGTEGKSDAELQALWDTVNGAPAAAPTAQTPAQTAAAVKRAWKAYNGDTEVTDFSKLSLDDFLNGKVQIGYNANNKEHRRAFDELVRNASQGHYNAERMQALQTERQTALDKWREYERQTTELNDSKQTWERALNAATRGDYTALQTILDVYQQQLNAPAGQPQQAQMVPAEQVHAQQMAVHNYNTIVMPKANDLASRYGLPQSEVAEAIMLMVENEPPEFMNPTRFAQIVDVELPGHIEAMMAARGATAQPAAVPPAVNTNAEIARLQAEVAQLRGQQAQSHNTHLAAVHQRRAAAPPAAPSLPASGAGSESPDFDSAAGARKWLDNLRG